MQTRARVCVCGFAGGAWVGGCMHALHSTAQSITDLWRYRDGDLSWRGMIYYKGAGLYIRYELYIIVWTGPMALFSHVSPLATHRLVSLAFGLFFLVWPLSTRRMGIHYLRTVSDLHVTSLEVRHEDKHDVCKCVFWKKKRDVETRAETQPTQRQRRGGVS